MIPDVVVVREVIQVLQDVLMVQERWWTVRKREAWERHHFLGQVRPDNRHVTTQWVVQDSGLPIRIKDSGVWFIGV